MSMSIAVSAVRFGLQYVGLYGDVHLAEREYRMGGSGD